MIADDREPVGEPEFERRLCRRHRSPGGGSEGAAEAPFDGQRSMAKYIGTALPVEGALELRAEPLKLLRVEPHPEAEPHLAQDRLDLVERLLAEVLRLQQVHLG